MRLPAFAPDGGFLLIGTHALFVAGLIGGFGALAVQALVVHPLAARAAKLAPDFDAEQPVRRFARAGLLLALATGPLLLWLQTADFAADWQPGTVLATLWPVLRDTRFGHTILVQELAACAALIAALPRAGRAGMSHHAGRAGAALAGLALAAEAAHAHLPSMATSLPGIGFALAVGIAHLLGGGFWVGGLWPFRRLIARAPTSLALQYARGFSIWGRRAVIAVAASGLWQAWVLVADLPGLFGTSYGWMVLIKIALFAVLLGFALRNRYRLVPRLARGGGAAARATLLRSIAWQSLAGIAVLAAAALLASLAPAIHQQPIWPFPIRPSFAAINEDADFRHEVIGAAIAVGGGVVLAGLGFALAGWRRLAAWALGLLLILRAVPHFDLIVVPADPQVYDHSPTQFATASILRGAALFAGHCALCHGATGAGNGPAAAALPIHPADLTAAHLWMHRDGQLFWWIGHGIAMPVGPGMAMPGFKPVLNHADRWALIDYLHAHNAGLVLRRTGHFSPPLQAPAMALTCAAHGARKAGAGAGSLADLAGHFVRLVLGPATPVAGVITVTTDPAAHPAPGLCVAADPTIAPAYAILAGYLAGPDAAAHVAGAAFLIDPAGWLRAVSAPAGTPDARQPGAWQNSAELAALIRRLAAHPITAEAGHAHMAM
ncbi:MAG: CopD family protein [Rhodospirillales bacterium]|nr:CopD family protein [Rhodospirillales bacterium]